MADKKLAEGDAFMKEADKLTTKTFTRWKPDWDGACGIYEKAGNSYKNAKAYEKSRDAFKKASTAYVNMGISFSAAKNMEAAASMSQANTNMEEAANLYEQACTLYRENGTPEKAAENLVKAAKILEDRDPEKAMQHAVEACDIYIDDEKEHFASSTFRTAIALSLRVKKYDIVLGLLKKQQGIHDRLNQPQDVFKAFLSQIIVHLYVDDYVAADRIYQEAVLYPGYSGSPECKVSQDLLDAYEKRNNEALQKALNHQTITFLDNEVAKLAKTLKVIGASEGSSIPEDGGGLA